jgi:hypothetical protein
MPSTGTLRRVVLVRIDISDECIAFTIIVIRIGVLGTTLAITSNFLRSVLRSLLTVNTVSSSPILSTLMMEAIRSSETSVIITHTA